MPLVQGAGRLQRHLLARATTSGPAASCAPAPATTARAWPSPATPSASDGRVYLPANTPRQKRQRIAAIGGDWVEPVIAGSSYDEASAAAHADAERTGAVYVHPFDDPRTIVGQGTIAPELLEQAGGPIDTVLVPVGGGGLLAGLAVWLKANAPAIHLVGVEPAGAASMRAALDAGHPVALDAVDTFVDGAAVGRVGDAHLPDRARPRRRDRGRARGRGVHRDARPLPVRGRHRRARRGAGQRRAAGAAAPPARRARWCASSPAATTT